MNKTLAPMVEMAHKHGVKLFADIVRENGHEIVKYDNVPMNAKHVMSAFCYSEMYGGAPDSFKYYNDYSVVVENV